MSLYALKMSQSPNSTAMGQGLFFAADSISDVMLNADYIKEHSMWLYHFPGVYWPDGAAAQQAGLLLTNAINFGTQVLKMQGNGQTLETLASGGGEYKISAGSGSQVMITTIIPTPSGTTFAHYTNFSASSTIFNFACDATVSDYTEDGKTYRYFALIPIFKLGTDPTDGYRVIDTTEFFTIVCYAVYDSANQIITDASTRIFDNTSVSAQKLAPYYTNTATPRGTGGTYTAPYQFVMSLIESITKVADGSETHGTEVYNDPNNPRGAAYPAQGYDSSGNRINLFEPGATGGIGGNGSFEEWRDDTGVIDLEGLPSYLGGQDTTPDTTSTGIFSIYQLSSSQLTQLNTKLWSNDFWQSMQNTNLSPLETVIALYKCKIPVESDGTGSIIMGRYDTEMTGTRCKQFKNITLPDVEIKRYYDTWLDQNPHTQLYLYLPYIGLVDINADYYMGRDLRIKYVFDFLSSTCIAKLFTIIDGKEILVETKQGQFGMQIPLTSSRRENIMGSILQTIAAVGATVAGVAMIASGAGAAVGAGAISATTAATTAGGVAAAGAGLNQTANGIQGMNKYSYAIASHIQANSAFMSSNKIYLFRVLPSVQLPEKYNELVGNTAYVSTIVQNLKGLSVVKNLKLDNVHATLAEKEELKQIFLSGVYM